MDETSAKGAPAGSELTKLHRRPVGEPLPHALPCMPQARSWLDRCVNISQDTRFTASIEVPFAPGKLEAVGFDASGNQIATRQFTTAGAAAQLRLIADRELLSPSRADLSYVVAEVVDEAGVRVACSNESIGSPCVPPTVSFLLSGNGEIAAAGTGDPIDTSSFSLRQPDGSISRKTYRGTATAIVRPGKLGVSPSEGKITLTAKAPGLKSATISLMVEKRSSVAAVA